MSNANAIPTSVLAALSMGADETLSATMQHFGCQAGTVHWLNADNLLVLAAYKNIPEHIAQVVQTVPIGKGVAGLAAQKLEPVSICNLQTDTSGRARPAAKTTGMEGSIAVPMLVGGDLRGVLGIAKVEAHDWNDEEKASLLRIASALGEKRP